MEGDLVSLVTEMTDREVTLPDLLTELTSNQVAMTPRLPTGCRFWLPLGSHRPLGVRPGATAQRRTIACHASQRYDAEPVTYRLALPFVMFVVSTYANQIEALASHRRTGGQGSPAVAWLRGTQGWFNTQRTHEGINYPLRVTAEQAHCAA